MMDDMFEDCFNQFVVDATCEAKNQHGSYNGATPMQWFVGRSRHPLVGTSEASPSLMPGSEFEEHLIRKTRAAQEFHAADAKNILKMASRARARVLQDVQAGQLVYYFRRGKRKDEAGYRGPAKIIAVERGEGESVQVAWLSHSGTLIRAAPEHLRMATPLETRSVDALENLGFSPDHIGSRYVDLGEAPTAAEQRQADYMQVDEPPPPEPGMSSDSGARSSGQNAPQVAHQPPPAPRQEPDAERTPEERDSGQRSEQGSDSSGDESMASSAPLATPPAQPEPEALPTPSSAPSPIQAPPPTGTDLNSGMSSEVQQAPARGSSGILSWETLHPRPPRPPPSSTAQRLYRDGPERDRSRSPRGDARTTASGSNANDVYFAHLTDLGRKKDGYLPTFTYAPGSKKASQVRGKAWDNMTFEAEVDVYEDDLIYFLPLRLRQPM